MSLPVLVRARAERDTRAILDWYETQEAGLGEQFVGHLRDALTAIRSPPQSGADDLQERATGICRNVSVCGVLRR